MKRKEWFPTGIYEFDSFLDYDPSKAYDVKNEGSAGVQLSNRGGWQSEDVSKDIRFNSIVDVLQSLSTSVYDDMYSVRGRYKLDNMWININGDDDYNVLHIHPKCHLSGVIYLKCDKDTGRIIFIDPRYSWRANEVDDMNTEDVKSCYQVHYEPKPGTILFFPNWLQHMVEPNKSTEDRISIAFNMHVEFD